MFNLLTEQQLESKEISVTDTENINIGTGDGTTTTFTANLPFPCIKGTMTISAGDIILEDDGNGHIVDSNGAQYGTIDYLNVVSLTFPTAPAQYTSIDCTYKYCKQYIYHYEVISKATPDGYMYMYIDYLKKDEDECKLTLQVGLKDYWFSAYDWNGNSYNMTLTDNLNERKRVQLAPGENIKVTIELIRNAIPNVDIVGFAEGTMTFGLR